MEPKRPHIRGGRKNNQSSMLDEILFSRVSILTDPSLDHIRHDFDVNTFLGRIDSPKSFLNNKHIAPVKEIFPFIVAGMSDGALSPPAWLGILNGVKYCNEKLNIPIVMSTGEGGVSKEVLKSDSLKYLILQIASGYFGWDNLIRLLPDFKELPAGIEIKAGQGAKPAMGGLLEKKKVTQRIAEQRGVPVNVDLYSPPVHHTLYSIEEFINKMP